MAENSKIEWTDHTWTPVAGCDPVSPACAFCYAALMAARLEAMGMAKYAGLATRHGNLGKWTGEVTLWEAEVLKPLTVKKPARWFLTSMGDVFHKKVPFDFIDKLFAVMALADWHEFYVLTKRPEIAALYLGEHSEPDMDGISRAALAEGQAQSIYHQRTGEDPSMWLSIYWPLKNVVIGCTDEDQERADERRPHMREIAAAGWRTFVSYEPALGPVDWSGWQFLSWLISGGESGQHARPSHPDWHRDARDWCADGNIPYLFKQWGEWTPGENVDHAQTRTEDVATWWNYEWLFDKVTPRMGAEMHRDDEPDVWRVGKKRAGRHLDGAVHNGKPEARE